MQRNQLSELGKISNKKIISYSEDFLTSKKLNKLLSKYGVFKSFEIIPNWSALFEKVNAGHGWAIVPEDVFKNKNIIKSTSAITSILIPESIFSSESYYLVYLSSNKHIKWFHEIITTIQSVRA